MISSPLDTASAKTDRFSSARLIADALLYEGYVLYPYRATAQKNHMRWQFGVLVPEDYARESGCERSSIVTDVVIDSRDSSTLTVQVRCLQIQHRGVEGIVDEPPHFVAVDALDVGDATMLPWDEAVEHEIELAPIALNATVHDGGTIERPLHLAAGESIEKLRDSRGRIVGRLVRRREAVDGVIRVTIRPADNRPADNRPADNRPADNRPADNKARLLRATIEVANTTCGHPPELGREVAMRFSLLAVHTLLAVDDAVLVSLLEPPDFAVTAVTNCSNDGTFPVLVGGVGTSDVMLSSPIILYDHPEVAAESAGDFCDATEIDEILALRVLTLTNEEKAQARGTDPRAAAIIDRCEDMPEEIWSRLHGAVRSLCAAEVSAPVAAPEQEASVPWWDPDLDASFDPFAATLLVDGVVVRSGTHVRLNPSRRADAHDLFYAGLCATVKGIFHDVDGQQHVAVALDDDPAADLDNWQGRFLYFHPDEIEVVS